MLATSATTGSTTSPTEWPSTDPHTTAASQKVQPVCHADSYAVALSSLTSHHYYERSRSQANVILLFQLLLSVSQSRYFFSFPNAHTQHSLNHLLSHIKPQTPQWPSLSTITHSLTSNLTISLLGPSIATLVPTSLLSIASTGPLVARIGIAVAGRLGTGGEAAGGHILPACGLME